MRKERQKIGENMRRDKSLEERHNGEEDTRVTSLDEALNPNLGPIVGVRFVEEIESGKYGDPKVRPFKCLFRAFTFGHCL